VVDFQPFYGNISSKILTVITTVGNAGERSIQYVNENILITEQRDKDTVKKKEGFTTNMREAHRIHPSMVDLPA
jgi:hypothetical protein